MTSHNRTGKTPIKPQQSKARHARRQHPVTSQAGLPPDQSVYCPGEPPTRSDRRRPRQCGFARQMFIKGASKCLRPGSANRPPDAGNPRTTGSCSYCARYQIRTPLMGDRNHAATAFCGSGHRWITDHSAFLQRRTCPAFKRSGSGTSGNENEGYSAAPSAPE